MHIITFSTHVCSENYWICPNSCKDKPVSFYVHITVAETTDLGENYGNLQNKLFETLFDYHGLKFVLDYSGSMLLQRLADLVHSRTKSQTFIMLPKVEGRPKGPPLGFLDTMRLSFNHSFV